MKIKNLLIFLLIILSIGAIAGGGSFLLFPEGYLGMTPESMLQHSPFPNFLIPGIILFTVFGVIPLFVVWGLLKQKSCKSAQAVNIFQDIHWSWSFAVYTGFALIIWITAVALIIKNYLGITYIVVL